MPCPCWQRSSSGILKLQGGSNGTFTATDSIGGHIDADATYLYFATRGGEIMRQAHDVDGEPEVLAEGQGHAFVVTADADGVYWTQAPDCNAGDVVSGSILALATEGGAVATVAAPTRCPLALRADENYVYWASTTYEQVARQGAIFRAEKLR